MLAHPLEASDLAALKPEAWRAEWKWDGIRVQIVATTGGRRLYSRGADDISGAFPEIVAAMDFNAVLDGELLVTRDGIVAPFADLQQRLNRKVVSAKMMERFPVVVRLYDLLFDGTEDLRTLPFDQRRSRLEAWIARVAPEHMDLSPLIRFSSLQELIALRDGARAASIEGLMLKRGDSPYLPGRVKGQWWKWKRDPLTVDAVLMYAQRGHGKRSSFYSDYTFGLWRGENWSLSARHISASPTRNSRFWTDGFATTPPPGLGQFARWRNRWCWRSPSMPHNCPTATNPASRCGSRAWHASAPTSRPPRQTGWKR